MWDIPICFDSVGCYWAKLAVIHQHFWAPGLWGLDARLWRHPEDPCRQPPQQVQHLCEASADHQEAASGARQTRTDPSIQATPWSTIPWQTGLLELQIEFTFAICFSSTGHRDLLDTWWDGSMQALLPKDCLHGFEGAEQLGKTQTGGYYDYSPWTWSSCWTIPWQCAMFWESYNGAFGLHADQAAQLHPLAAVLCEPQRGQLRKGNKAPDSPTDVR